MSAWRAFVVRCRDLVQPDAARRRRAVLDEEMRAHLDALAADYERRGLSPDDARAAARRDFGGATQIQEAWDDVRGFPWLANAGRDLRLALRLVRRQPVSALTSVLSLGIAIGGATAVYLVIDACSSTGALAVTRPHRASSASNRKSGTGAGILPEPDLPAPPRRRVRQSVTGIAAVNELTAMRHAARRNGFVGVRAGEPRVGLVTSRCSACRRRSGRSIDERDDESPKPSCVRRCSVTGLDSTVPCRSRRARPAPAGQRGRLRHCRRDAGGVRQPPRRLRARALAPAPAAHEPARSRKLFRRVLLGCYWPAEAWNRRRRGRARIDGDLSAHSPRRPRRSRGEQPIHPFHRLDSVVIGRVRNGPPARSLRPGARDSRRVRRSGPDCRRRQCRERDARPWPRASAGAGDASRVGAGSARLVAQLCAEGAVVVGAGVLTGLAIAALLAPVIASFVTLDYQTIALGIMLLFRAALFVSAVAILLVL